MHTKAPLKHRWVQVLAIIGLVLMLVAIFIGGRQPDAGNLFNPPWNKVVHLITYVVMASVVYWRFCRMIGSKRNWAG